MPIAWRSRLSTANVCYFHSNSDCIVNYKAAVINNHKLFSSYGNGWVIIPIFIFDIFPCLR
jgi:hypothetical protein